MTQNVNKVRVTELDGMGRSATIDIQRGIGLYLIRERIAQLWNVPMAYVKAEYLRPEEAG